MQRVINPVPARWSQLEHVAQLIASVGSSRAVQSACFEGQVASWSRPLKVRPGERVDCRYHPTTHHGCKLENRASAIDATGGGPPIQVPCLIEDNADDWKTSVGATGETVQNALCP